MTCIIALKSELNGTITLGSDRQANFGNEKIILELPKIYPINSEIYVGAAGDLRYSDILKTMQLDDKISIEDPYQYILKIFVPNMKKCCGDNDYTNEHGRTIVIYKNNIYTISSDYSILLCKKYYAIGSGEDYAMGALKILESQHISPYEKVEKALEVASIFDNCVSPPFDIITI